MATRWLETFASNCSSQAGAEVKSVDIGGMDGRFSVSSDLQVIPPLYSGMLSDLSNFLEDGRLRECVDCVFGKK